MRLRSAIPLFALSASTSVSRPVQWRTVDEGTFSVSRTGKPAVTENFKIQKGDDGSTLATARVVSGAQVMTSTLAVDSAGMPTRYEVVVTERGTKTMSVMAAGRAGRLTAQTVNQRGDESMREYPLGQGRCLILEDGLVHELYFAAIGARPGTFHIVSPRDARSMPGTLAAAGLEPLDVGGRNVTATHYALTAGGVQRDFWVDAAGRLLKVSIPSEGLTAIRDELPR
jgi:hypothetical protein